MNKRHTARKTSLREGMCSRASFTVSDADSSSKLANQREQKRIAESSSKLSDASKQRECISIACLRKLSRIVLCFLKSSVSSCRSFRALTWSCSSSFRDKSCEVFASSMLRCSISCFFLSTYTFHLMPSGDFNVA